MSKNEHEPKTLQVPDEFYKKLRETIDSLPSDKYNAVFNLPDLRKWSEKQTLRVTVRIIESERAQAKEHRSRRRANMARSLVYNEDVGVERGEED